MTARPGPHPPTAGPAPRAETAPAVPPARPRPEEPGTARRPPPRILAAAAQLPARARHGRPARLAARTALTAAAWQTINQTIPGTPAGIAIQAATLLWWLDTTRTELAPPRRKQPRTPAPRTRTAPTEEEAHDT